MACKIYKEEDIEMVLGILQTIESVDPRNLSMYLQNAVTILTHGEQGELMDNLGQELYESAEWISAVADEGDNHWLVQGLTDLEEKLFGDKLND